MDSNTLANLQLENVRLVARIEEAHATFDRVSNNWNEAICRWARLDAMIASSLKSLETTITTSPRDWSLDGHDAWTYGILVGWSDLRLHDLAARFGWSLEDVAQVKSMHASLREAKDKI